MNIPNLIKTIACLTFVLAYCVEFKPTSAVFAVVWVLLAVMWAVTSFA